jgi:hypothetical protein
MNHDEYLGKPRLTKAELVCCCSYSCRWLHMGQGSPAVVLLSCCCCCWCWVWLVPPLLKLR